MIKQIVTIGLEEIRYGLASTYYWMTSSKMNSKSIILVNGSPKTGTTWMLRMLASLPGYQDADNFQRNSKSYEEAKPGNVIHGHEPFTPQLWSILLSKGIRVILTVRDPRDQSVSRLFHIRRDSTHSWHSRFREMNNDDALMACIKGGADLPGADIMLKLTYSWLKQKGYAFCVRYEDLLLQPEDKLRDVLQYLDVTASEGLIQAIVARNRFARLSIGKKIWQTARQSGQQAPNSHFRKGISGDWKNYFKEEHCLQFKEVAGQSLIELGYEKDLSW